jgi:hypothetical protein
MALPVAPNPVQWPQPHTGAVNPNQVYAADLNSQLRDAVSFLASPPAFFARASVVQSIASNTNTNVVLQNAVFDNYLGQNDNTFISYSIPAGCGGIWLAGGSVGYTMGTSDNISANINLGGGAIDNGGTVPGGLSPLTGVFDLISYTGGYPVELLTAQASSGNANTLVNATQFPWMSLRWVANTTGTAGLTPPSPATWTSNQLCTTTNFNTEIYNAVSFLSYVPYFRAAQTSSQSFPSGATTALANMASTLDNYGTFAANKWTCPVAGTYLVGWQVGFSSIISASYEAQLLTRIGGVNATYHSGAVGGHTATVIHGVKVFRLSANDTLQLAAIQNAGGNLNTLSGNLTRFFTLWMSE